MVNDSFHLECDRISRCVDGTQFERQRWARTEGPMLARLVELAHQTFADREDFELVEEGATADVKRFALKVHANRVASIAIWLNRGLAMITIEPLDRSRYGVAPGQPLADDFALVDEHWMAAAMQHLFGRIQFAG